MRGENGMGKGKEQCPYKGGKGRGGENGSGKRREERNERGKGEEGASL